MEKQACSQGELEPGSQDSDTVILSILSHKQYSQESKIRQNDPEDDAKVGNSKRKALGISQEACTPRLYQTYYGLTSVPHGLRYRYLFYIYKFSLVFRFILHKRTSVNVLGFNQYDCLYEVRYYAAHYRVIIGSP